MAYSLYVITNARLTGRAGSGAISTGKITSDEIRNDGLDTPLLAAG